MIEIRNLPTEDLRLWYQVSYPEEIPSKGRKRKNEREIQEKVSELKEKFQTGIEKPNDFFLAFKDGKVAGKIYRYRDMQLNNGSIEETGLWLLQAFVLRPDIKEEKIAGEIFTSFVKHIKNLSGWKELKIMLNHNMEFDLNKYLPEMNFYLQSQKQYFWKDLMEMDIEACEKDVSKLEYKTLPETGDKDFVKLFQKIQSSSLNSDSIEDALEPEKAFQGLKDPERFSPDLWVIAYKDNKPVGIVLPGIEKNRKPLRGFIQFIGVLPEYRGAGTGKILLKKGILEMAKLGAEEYMGSTETPNIPMMKVFSALGCHKANLYNMWTKK